MLPRQVRLISGPGCPVCVTSQAYFDLALTLAGRDGFTIATYGDMVRVPGTFGSLAQARSRGADVLVVYSARDALAYAVQHPERQVVFLGVGFETTAPATALTVLEAKRRRVDNFTVLTAHKLVIPAMNALLQADETAIDGFLCPGHVSVVIGLQAYRPIVERYHRPCVVGGFEPETMLDAIATLVRAVRDHEALLHNAYGAVVRDEGSAAALRVLEQVFEPADAVWRAIGTIRGSGLELREEFWQFDAARRFGLELGPDVEPEGCRCGEVIQGLIDPPQCPLYRKACTPQRPVGPCMVSSEGTCAAWFKYTRTRQEVTHERQVDS